MCIRDRDDPEHTRHRKMWNPAFTAAAMERYIPVMQRVITERSSHWPEHEKIDIYAEAREITFDIAAAALGGIERGVDVDRMRQMFYVLLSGFSPDQEDAQNYELNYMPVSYTHLDVYKRQGRIPITSTANFALQRAD